MTFQQQVTLSLVDKLAIGLLLALVAAYLNRKLEKVRHELGLLSARTQITRQSEIQYRERQLSEFYGPVYALLKQIRPLDDLWSAGKLSGTDQAVIQHIRRANDRVVEILLTKSYLMEGDVIPQSFNQFLTHAALWHAYMDAPDADWESWRTLQEAHYDRAFETTVYASTEDLKRQLSELYEQYGLAVTRG
jgi:hypothetical protein